MLIVNKRLIEKLKAKDELAFEQVYYEYEKLVYYICYSITKDKNASEDLTQADINGDGVTYDRDVSEEGGVSDDESSTDL